MSSVPLVRSRARSLLLLFGALAALTSPGRAGDGRPVSRPGVLHLDLEAAIRMALAKNFTIQVSEFEPRIAREDITKARGFFDPVLEIGPSRTYQSTHGKLVAGSRADEHLISRTDIPIDAGLRGNTVLGSQYRFGWNSTDALGTANLGFGSILSGPKVSLTQPLLSGFGPTATLYGIRIARTNAQISEWHLRQAIIDVITQLVYVYNELQFASQDLRVAESSRELARQLYQDNSRRAAIGVMSPLDITTARAEVAAREEGVILAQRTVLDNENLLKQLVTNDLEPMLSVRVEIEPPPSSGVRVETLAGLRDALAQRPDYREAMLDLQQRHITVAFAKNQAIPKLDLNASLTLLGLDTDYAGSAARFARGDSLAYTAGAQFSYPLGNRVARANVNTARLEAARAIIDLQRLEQQIVVEVDNAAGQVTTDRARIRSTAEASRLAKESLDAGEQRLRAGTGTTFEVLGLQDKLATAESAELRAQSDHNKAVAEFFRKTGVSLQRHYVEVH